MRIEQLKPKYAQLRDLIKEEILKNGYAPGTRLDSEPEMIRKYQVSNSTVEKAISGLLNEGLIYRQQGKGTFVADFRAKAEPGAGKVIGLIMPFRFKSNTTFAEMLEGIEETVSSRGYDLLVSSSQNSLEVELNQIDRVTKSARGLILCPTYFDHESEAGIKSLSNLKSSGFPFVFVDQYIVGLNSDYVTTDNYSGAYQAVKHFVSLGYRNIRFVYSEGTNFLPPSIARMKGYIQAVRDLGIGALYASDGEMALGGVPESKAGLSVCKLLLSRYMQDTARPVAIFAAHCDPALRMIQAAKEMGFRIPEDVAVIGFDGLPIAEGKLGVHLTRIQQPMLEMGRRAAQILIDKIEYGVTEVANVELEPRLIVGDSCGAGTAGIVPEDQLVYEFQCLSF